MGLFRLRNLDLAGKKMQRLVRQNTCLTLTGKLIYFVFEGAIVH